jgi:hypothetical protein
VADECVGDLTRRVGTAHVGVMVIDRRDPPMQRLLKRLAGTLGLGQLGHLAVQFARRTTLANLAPAP